MQKEPADNEIGSGHMTTSKFEEGCVQSTQRSPAFGERPYGAPPPPSKHSRSQLIEYTYNVIRTAGEER